MRNMKSRLTTATFVTAIALGTIGVGTAHADQPDMYAARNDLQQAIGSLQSAQDDKGGHRVAAIGLAQQAIEQVNLPRATSRPRPRSSDLRWFPATGICRLPSTNWRQPQRTKAGIALPR